MNARRQAQMARALIALGYKGEVVDFAGLHEQARDARRCALAAEEAVSGYTPNNRAAFRRHAVKERLLARFLGHLAESGRRWQAGFGTQLPPNEEGSYPTRAVWDATGYVKTDWPCPVSLEV